MANERSMGHLGFQCLAARSSYAIRRFRPSADKALATMQVTILFQLAQLGSDRTVADLQSLFERSKVERAIERKSGQNAEPDWAVDCGVQAVEINWNGHLAAPL